MYEPSKQKVSRLKILFWTLVVGSIVLPLILLALWLGNSTSTDSAGQVARETAGDRLFVTVVVIVVWVLCWYIYSYLKTHNNKITALLVPEEAAPSAQPNIAQSTTTIQAAENLGTTVVSGIYKYEGWKYKVQAILSFIFGSALAFVGILFLLIFHNVPFIGITFIAFGGLLIFAGWFYWKRSKPFTKGRLY